jgi:hypothetical protein
MTKNELIDFVSALPGDIIEKAYACELIQIPTIHVHYDSGIAKTYRDSFTMDANGFMEAHIDFNGRTTKILLT